MVQAMSPKPKNQSEILPQISNRARRGKTKASSLPLLTQMAIRLSSHPTQPGQQTPILRLCLGRLSPTSLLSGSSRTAAPVPRVSSNSRIKRAAASSKKIFRSRLEATKPLSIQFPYLPRRRQYLLLHFSPRLRQASCLRCGRRSSVDMKSIRCSSRLSLISRPMIQSR